MSEYSVVMPSARIFVALFSVFSSGLRVFNESVHPCAVFGAPCLVCLCQFVCVILSFPTNPSVTPQGLQEWRRLSDSATAASVAAAEDVAPSPSRETAHSV